MTEYFSAVYFVTRVVIVSRKYFGQFIQPPSLSAKINKINCLWLVRQRVFRVCVICDVMNVISKQTKNYSMFI